MSTKFIRATHIDGRTTAPHDSEFPIGLFQEICQQGTFDASEWQIDLLDWKGDLIESNWDWRGESVRVNLGDLVDGGYSFPDTRL